MENVKGKKVKIEGNIKDYLSKPTTNKQSNLGELFSVSTLTDYTTLSIFYFPINILEITH